MCVTYVVVVVVFYIFILQALKWATCGMMAYDAVGNENENGKTRQEAVWPSTWRTLARLSNLAY